MLQRPSAVRVHRILVIDMVLAGLVLIDDVENAPALGRGEILLIEITDVGIRTGLSSPHAGSG